MGSVWYEIICARWTYMRSRSIMTSDLDKGKVKSLLSHLSTIFQTQSFFANIALIRLTMVHLEIGENWNRLCLGGSQIKYSFTNWPWNGLTYRKIKILLDVVIADIWLRSPIKTFKFNKRIDTLVMWHNIFRGFWHFYFIHLLDLHLVQRSI